MKRLLFMLFLICFAASRVMSQSFTVDDLLKLSSLPSKDIAQFMSKKEYSPHAGSLDNNLIATIFNENAKARKRDSLNSRSIDLYKKDDSKYFVLHTSSMNEFMDGKSQLIKEGFFYDTNLNPGQDTSMLFQKLNITIETLTGMDDSLPVYSFLLKKKELPDPRSIQHAEDLLNFTSHQYLVGFFGESNVKKDLYYFSDKEIRKCSVLFANTNHQAVFVWGDENNLCDLAYVLISNESPTLSSQQYSGFISNNEWQLKNGLRPGMGINELLKLNEKDFEIYGNQSEYAFIVKPDNSGKIDFRKFAISFSCNNCNNEKLLNTSYIKATDVLQEMLPMHVTNIIIFSKNH